MDNHERHQLERIARSLESIDKNLALLLAGGTPEQADKIGALTAKLKASGDLLAAANAGGAQVPPKEKLTMAPLDDAIAALTTQVQANTDAEASAVTLIQGLATQIAAVANDPAAVTALATKLKASADSLAAAVVANTPAA